MKLNLTFSVIARCRKFKRGEDPNSAIEKEDIELTFDLEKALRFLLRFYNNGMIINEYKLLFKMNSSGSLQSMVLFKDDYVYIVINEGQFVNDILTGYNYLITMDKVSDIMDFDFKAALEFNNRESIEDEFGNEKS